MATAASDPRKAPPRQAGIPVRPSGVMPTFRGSVPLAEPVRNPPPLRVARAPGVEQQAVGNDDELWAAALAAAKQRAEQEEEERAWAAAMERARQLAAEEEREWAALRARAAEQTPRPQASRRPTGRVFTWP